MKGFEIQRIIAVLIVIVSIAISTFFNSNEELYRVERVVDGDTVIISKDGEEIKTRLIGINTPETVDPRKPIECFGKEASDFLKQKIEGKYVSIENDETQQKYDRYDRELVYMYFNDVLINRLMIEEGYAYEYTYDVLYLHQEDFKKTEEYARENSVGLWGAGCGE